MATLDEARSALDEAGYVLLIAEEECDQRLYRLVTLSGDEVGEARPDPRYGHWSVSVDGRDRITVPYLAPSQTDSISAEGRAWALLHSEAAAAGLRVIWDSP